MYYFVSIFSEFSSLRKLGITDPTSYLKDVLSPEEAESIVVLSSCAMSGQQWSEIVDSAEDSLLKRGWVDVGSQIPSEISSEENTESACFLLQKSHKEWISCQEAFLYRDSLLTDVKKTFQERIVEKAQSAAPEVMKMMKAEKKENVGAGEEAKGKKRGGKKGGGGKRRGGKEEEEETPVGDSGKIEFMSEDEIADELARSEEFGECPEPILKEVAERIRPDLNSAYRAKVESVYLSSQADAASLLKKSHGEFQEQMKAVYQHICMFESGADIFDGTKLRGRKKYYSLGRDGMERNVLSQRSISAGGGGGVSSPPNKDHIPSEPRFF